MNEIKKRKLLMEYKYMKTEMGIFAFECKETGISYIQFTHDTKSALNSNKFKLNAGIHPNKFLQNDWKQFGEDAFIVRVLEVLPYDKKDNDKKDYSEELVLLRDKWIDKESKSEIL